MCSHRASSAIEIQITHIFEGFNHLCFFNLYHEAVFCFQKGYKRRFLKWGHSYQAELQLWSVITDGYQYFLWSELSVGRKIPPVGGRYLLLLLLLFGPSTSLPPPPLLHSRLKVNVSFLSEKIGFLWESKLNHMTRLERNCCSVQFVWDQICYRFRCWMETK